MDQTLVALAKKIRPISAHPHDNLNRQRTLGIFRHFQPIALRCAESTDPQRLYNRTVQYPPQTLRKSLAATSAGDDGRRNVSFPTCFFSLCYIVEGRFSVRFRRCRLYLCSC
ncbi:unnamed protein product, partial [Ectocarpus sp. 12 AP-2014]